MDSEQSARLLLIGGVGAVLLIALAFVGFGYWYSEIRPEGRTVLQLDDTKVSFAEMKRRMKYELFQTTIYQQAPQLLPQAAFDALRDELLVTQRAESAENVVASEQEFNDKLRTRLGVAPQADNSVFAEALRSQLDVTGLHQDEFERMVRAELLEEKLTAKFKEALPANVLQARLEVIATDSREDAQAAIDRINAGEEFAAVARDVSTEPDVADTGGVKEYAPKGSFNAAYDNFAFTADIGVLSEPLSDASETRWYVVRVIDRSEQPATEAHRTSLASQEFDAWLERMRDEATESGALVINWDQDDQDEALVDVIEGERDRLIRQEQERQEQQRRALELQQTTVAQLTQSPQPAGTPDPNATSPAATPPADGATPPAGTPPPASSSDGAVTPGGAGTPASGSDGQ